MILRNYNRNENSAENNSGTADLINASGNNSVDNRQKSNGNGSVSTVYYNHYPMQNNSTEFNYNNTIIQNPRENISFNHQSSNIHNIQYSGFPNFPVSNYCNSSYNSQVSGFPVPPICVQQHYNPNSSASMVFPANMNNVNNQGIAIQQSIVSTTTRISQGTNPQYFDAAHSNYHPTCNDNNSYNFQIPQNEYQYNNSQQFSRSTSHIGVPDSLYSSQPPVKFEAPVVNQLSHSFSNFTINNSLPNAQWNANSYMVKSEAHSVQNNSYNHFPELPHSSRNEDNNIKYNSTLNNSFNHIPSFNTSSQSLPQSCQSINAHQNKDLQNLTTSMSMSTPTVVPDSDKSNLNDKINVPTKMLDSNDTQTKNSYSSFIGNNNLTPSRRMINVMEERLLIPPTGIMNPVPNLLNITKKPNCSPGIMRCTLNAVPNSEDILNKIRLPFVVHIHAFKDLSNLQVIRSEKIVRCRTISCRAYLNPFVSFPDQRRWKCNICQRVNELTNNFLYDESLEMVIELQKRPEVRLATVEYIAPKEYSMKNFQVPVYVFMIDISANAIHSLYSNSINRILNTIDELLDRLPGYQHAKFALIGYDTNIHLYPINEKRCHEIVLSDISILSEIPNPSEVLFDVHKHKDQIQELLTTLLENVDNDLPSHLTSAASCLGSAILVAKQIINNLGGRITIFNASCPSIGEGILFPRESRKSSSFFPLTPDKEFYKTLSLECAQAQIGVDLFQLGKVPCDLASLSIISRFCGGSLFHYPDLAINHKENLKDDDKCILEMQRLLYDLNRYLSRKIGFDAVLRIRHSPELNIMSSHGNFFARATDLYSMANVNPDSGISLKIGISDSFLDNNVIFFQTALLYTSSLGERRIRVHTLCLPVSSQIEEVFRMADHQAIAAFLAKSVSDRLQSNGKIIEAREALINAVVDPSCAFGEFCLTSSQILTSLPFPYHLRLLPLYVWGLLQSKCLQLTNNDSDSSVAILDNWRNMPLSYLLVDIYPSLYNLSSVAYLSSKQKEKLNAMLESNDKSDSCSIIDDMGSTVDDTVEPAYSSESEASSYDSEVGSGISCYDSKTRQQIDGRESEKQEDADLESDDEEIWFPEHLHLNIKSMPRCGAYLLETSRGLILLMTGDTPRIFFHQVLGIDSISELPTIGNIQLPDLNSAASLQLRLFIKDLQIDRPIGSHLFIINNYNSHLNTLFQSHMLEDDKFDSSYHIFLKQIQRKVVK